MAFDIEEFKSSMNKLGGLAKANLFAIRITPHGTHTTLAGNAEDNRTISFLAHAASIPGVSFIQQDIKTQGFGLLERRAGDAIMPNWTASFLLDNSGKVLQYFNDWSRAIYSFANLENNMQVDSQTSGYLGQVGYYENYVSDIEIIMYAPDSAKITTYKLIEAYPNQIADVTLGWRQNDEIAELQVTFMFKHWIAETYDTEAREKEPGQMNLLQFVSKIKSAVDIVKSFKKPNSIGDALNQINNGKILFKSFGG